MAQFGAPPLQISVPPPVSPAATAAGGSAPPPPSSSASAAAASGPSPGSGTAPAATPSSQPAPPPKPAPAPNPPQHKRVYQACIPCRRRKVRCDLGPVDDPHDPPCVRCRRESKECFFSATRRKRKADDGSLDGAELDEYILRNGRKQFRGSSLFLDRRFYSDVPLTPGGSHVRSHPLRRPGDSSKSVRSTSTSSAATTTTTTAAATAAAAAAEFGNGEPNTPLENLEARNVMRREVYGPHDALDLLYKAATDKLVVLSVPSQPARCPPPPPFFFLQSVRC